MSWTWKTNRTQCPSHKSSIGHFFTFKNQVNQKWNNSKKKIIIKNSAKLTLSGSLRANWWSLVAILSIMADFLKFLQPSVIRKGVLYYLCDNAKRAIGLHSPFPLLKPQPLKAYIPSVLVLSFNFFGCCKLCLPSPVTNDAMELGAEFFLVNTRVSR